LGWDLALKCACQSPPIALDEPAGVELPLDTPAEAVLGLAGWQPSINPNACPIKVPIIQLGFGVIDGRVSRTASCVPDSVRELGDHRVYFPTPVKGRLGGMVLAQSIAVVPNLRKI
jgi:hypothetical protein